MRKLLVLAVVVAGFLIPAAALAATLDTSKFGDFIGAGSKCTFGGVYHFVNNQTGGQQTPGTLTVVFFDNPGTHTVTAGPSLINKNVQQFYVTSTGTLQSASTNLDGKLVISDESCKK